MITDLARRWNEGRQRWSPKREIFDPRAYEVAELKGDTEPKRFVELHHYSGTYPAARFRFGLFRRGELSGVAVFSHPMTDRVLTNVFPWEAMAGVELGRLVLLESVAYNAESWFVAQAFDKLQALGIRGVISTSDPMPRLTRVGEVVMPGHVGQVYQALNATYLDRTKARTLYFLPDGSVFSDRAAQKVRRRERGWRYCVDQLVDAGAERTEEPDARWLTSSLAHVVRKVRHRGNHKFAWVLNRRDRRAIPPPNPDDYPKVKDAPMVAA